MSVDAAPKYATEGALGDAREKPALVSADGVFAATGGALATVGFGVAATNWPHALLGLGALGVGCLLLVRGLRRLSEAERIVAEIGGMKGVSHLDRVRALSARVDLVLRRSAQLHPVTGLQTREPLAAAINNDVDAQDGELVLGAVRLVDFDRLAAFDARQANAALKRFATRLAAATAHPVGQIDRDCFCIWFGGAPGATAIRELEAVAYVAGQELQVGTQTLMPTIELGAVTAAKGDDAAGLFARVTVALRRLDDVTEADVALVGGATANDARERFMLEQHLAKAISHDQLTLVFQPVVDLEAGRVLGAEALLRWEHPEFGHISPATFIPVMEAMGLSERCGLWVLNAACREARRWRDEGLGDLKVAVNLSAKQLTDPGLRLKVERTLQRHDLHPQLLELELTETAAMADAQHTSSVFRDLRAMGVSLAIDDFGAGYSSLSYLKNLPFDKLKIDREFVTHVHERPDSAAICRALIELGRGLGLLVLAEGVETVDEVAALQRLGCSIFQGYYFSRPLKAVDFAVFARNPIPSIASGAASPTLILSKDGLPA